MQIELAIQMPELVAYYVMRDTLPTGNLLVAHTRRKAPSDHELARWQNLHHPHRTDPAMQTAVLSVQADLDLRTPKALTAQQRFHYLRRNAFRG